MWSTFFLSLKLTKNILRKETLLFPRGPKLEIFAGGTQNKKGWQSPFSQATAKKHLFYLKFNLTGGGAQARVPPLQFCSAFLYIMFSTLCSAVRILYTV